VHESQHSLQRPEIAPKHLSNQGGSAEWLCTAEDRNFSGSGRTTLAVVTSCKLMSLVGHWSGGTIRC